MLDYGVLALNPLFSGMSNVEIKESLSVFSASCQFYEKNSIIASSCCLKRFGLILSGTVQVAFTDIDGNSVLMASVGRGDTFGESMCWLQMEEIPVTITAFEDVSLVWLSPDSLRGDVHSVLVKNLRNRFISMLATKTLSMNDRVQVLSKPTIRQKLVTYFSQCRNHFGSNVFTIPFDRETLAMYLAVNRSALSRELSLMQAEGIIEFYKNSFKILK